MKSVIAKINRAEKLLEELNIEAKFFWASLKVECAIEETRPVYRVTELAEIPETVSSIFSDLIHNLNSALDCIAFSEFTLNQESTLDPKKVYFVIYQSIEDFDKKVLSTENISKRFLKIVSEIKPYKENNLLLWQIRELDNVAKHRNILITLPELTGVNISQHFRQVQIDNGFPNFSFPELFLRPADGSLNVGSVVFTGAPDSVCSLEQRFNFDLFVVENGCEVKKSIGSFANEALEEVKRIYNLFKLKA